MSSVNSLTSTLGSEPLNPPDGIKLDTAEKEQLYRASLEFERFFVQQLLKPMESAGKMLGGEEGEGTGSTSGYGDMAQDQLTQSVLDGGGLGLAATLYGQMATSLGIKTEADAKTPAPAAPPTAAPAAPGGEAA